MPESLRELTWTSVFLRIALSFIVGGSIGIERGSKNQPAGFRTYLLVCLGSTIVMMTGQYSSVYFHTGDPTRLGAQVISGIGFLGVGTIILTGRNEVRGLTTAAGLWASACIGLAIGIGFYEGAVVGGLSVLAVFTILQKIDVMLLKRAKVFRIFASFDCAEEIDEFVEFCKKIDLTVKDVQFSKISKNANKGKNKYVAAVFVLENKKRELHSQLLQSISGFEGLKYIEEL